MGEVYKKGGHFKMKMKSVKRLIAATLATVMTVGLAGCGGNKQLATMLPLAQQTLVPALM